MPEFVKIEYKNGKNNIVPLDQNSFNEFQKLYNDAFTDAFQSDEPNLILGEETVTPAPKPEPEPEPEPTPEPEIEFEVDERTLRQRLLGRLPEGLQNLLNFTPEPEEEEEVVAVEPEKKEEVVAVEPEEEEAKPKIHTVVKGDLLSKIAEKNNTSVEKLMEINGIENADKIEIGQVIVLEDTKEQRENLLDEAQEAVNVDPSQLEEVSEFPEYQDGKSFNLGTVSIPDKKDTKFGNITDFTVTTTVVFKEGKAFINEKSILKMNGVEQEQDKADIITKEEYEVMRKQKNVQ